MPGRWKKLREKNLAKGLNTTQNPSLLMEGETPDCVNVDFDRGSVMRARGALKFNNQTAPRAGLLTGIDGADSSLPVLPGKSAPIRGAAFLPYLESQDIGGTYAGIKTVSGLAAPNDTVWHTQRGRSFELPLSFRLERDFRLSVCPTLGALNTVAEGSTWDTKFGSDQALDEFVAILQKGGDRLTPMSWAIGIVNTGELFDIDVGGGLNIFGLSVDEHATRVSNYALCFMWLDAPQFGVQRPVQMRYSLGSGGKISSYETYNAAPALNYVSNNFGEYCTLAYRSFIVPFFVEPGRNHHVSVRLSLDTGSPGTGTEPGITGDSPQWNEDGWLEVRAARDYEASTLFRYDQSSSEILRYKGPSDSLEYLIKYGIRWWGRDAMFSGLNMRYAPWASGGFVPFGIDSAPVEVGGHQLTDQSAHGSVGIIYAERLRPEEETSATNILTSCPYVLKIAHNPAQDPTGTKFEINQAGFVKDTASAGCTWGRETGVWAGIGCQGKSPFGAYGAEWAGLGGLVASPDCGFNSEALKSYRVVFSQSTGLGFGAVGAAGQMLSIDKYFLSSAYGVVTYAGQHFTTEGGDSWVNAAPPTIGAGVHYFITLRAFRWNQKPLVVSDVRVFSEPREWSESVEAGFSHDSSKSDQGSQDLVAHWPFDDAGGRELRELISGNSGFMLPMGMTTTERSSIGQQALFLSGEGEALYHDLGENEDFLEQLRASMRTGHGGCAIQISMRLCEAFYGMQHRVPTEDGKYNPGANEYRIRHRFAPVLASWDVKRPDRKDFDSSAGGGTRYDSVGGFLYRPAPLMELGHNVELEYNAAGYSHIYPMGFSLSCPSGSDQRNFDSKVPGTGATGLHAWWDNAGVDTPRWSELAPWVGRSITLQIGFHPTGVEDQFKVYISAWPKDALLPVHGDRPNAEFGYWSTQTIRRRDIMRTVITIGGAWNPRIADEYDATEVSWQSRGRSVWEACARMIVESVAVIPAAAAGALPAASGGVVGEGSGKIIGSSGLPMRDLETDDLLVPVGSGYGNVVSGSFTVNRSGVAPFSITPPQDSAAAVLRTFVLIDRERLSAPTDTDPVRTVTKSYFVSAFGNGPTITLNRPYVGATRDAAALRSFRVAAFASFSDDIRDKPLVIGSGQGYDIELIESSDAIITSSYFSNASPLETPWRLRIFSSIASGASSSLHPKWVRAAKLGRGNAIRGLHGYGDQLFAGAANGGIFEVDDRWRGSAMAFLGDHSDEGVVFPRQDDRVEFETSVSATDALLHGPHSTFVLDARVELDGISGTRTIAWCGNPNSDPSRAIGDHQMQWWTGISEGRPFIILGSTDTVGGVVSNRGRFRATAEIDIQVGEKAHIRWMLECDNLSRTVQIPRCWVNGKQTAVSVSAVGDLATWGSMPWLELSTIVPVAAGWVILLGCAHENAVVLSTYAAPTAIQNASLWPIVAPNIQGFVHCLGGVLDRVAIAEAVDTKAGFEPTKNFDPEAIDYTIDAKFEALESGGGVGIDVSGGVVMSHPFISLSHEMGIGDPAWSWADAESEVYVTNGGRLGVIEDDGQ